MDDKPTYEVCSCEEALALRRELDRAADLLARLTRTPAGELGYPSILQQARTWLLERAASPQ